MSKGTGIIHVNVDKESVGTDTPKRSRLSSNFGFPRLILVMRQQGTMKVMWNVRLFKGMKLLPRQVSDGDRRMDVYVKMVLVDDGRPKSFALKVSFLAAWTNNSFGITLSWINCTLQSRRQSRHKGQ